MASHGRLRWRFGSRPLSCCAPSGDDPVLILDDVFAELDEKRRLGWPQLVAPAEQVLVTAAVAGDVHDALSGAQYSVGAGR